MRAHEEILICLHADWKAWQSATVRFTELRDVHWHQPVGAPHAMVHGYVGCTTIVAGDIPHNCDPTSAPHRLRVCVLKRHTTDAVYAVLARLADEGLSPAYERTDRIGSVTLAAGRWH
jgi:hypothetical protein